MPDPLLTAVLEIKELLKLIAEPHVAERDKKLRSALRNLVGKSGVKIRVVQLLDGTRSQTEIAQVAKIDRSDLSKFIKALRQADLLKAEEALTLALELPSNFFEASEEER